MNHQMRRFSLALVGALLACLPLVARADQILPAPQIDNAGNLKFRGGPTLGKVNGSQLDGSTSLCWRRVAGAVCRTSAERAADRTNVKDFGAKLDGTDDTAAFAAARAATPNYGEIYVPPGLVNATIPVDPSKTIIWHMDGANQHSGGGPVYALGSDIVENGIKGGGRYVSKGATYANSNDVATYRQNITENAAGAYGGVRRTLSVLTSIVPGAKPSAYTYGFVSEIGDASTKTSPTPGNSVAAFLGAYRQCVAISGGACTQPGLTHMWAGNFMARDETGLPSSASGGAATIATEFDIFGANVDDANSRAAIDVAVGQRVGAGMSSPGFMEAASGLRTTSETFNGVADPNSWFKTPFANLAYTSVAAFDASGSLWRPGSTRTAFKVGSNNNIDFSSNHSRLLTYNPGGALQYISGSTVLLSQNDNGTLAVSNGTYVCSLVPSTSSTWSCSSDERFKRDIVDSNPALPRLTDMRVRDFTLEDTGERKTGVIAQELQRIHPEMVSKADDGSLKVEQPNPWVLVKAVQELKAENEQQWLVIYGEAAAIVSMAAAALFRRCRSV